MGHPRRLRHGGGLAQLLRIMRDPSQPVGRRDAYAAGPIGLLPATPAASGQLRGDVDDDAAVKQSPSNRPGANPRRPLEGRPVSASGLLPES